MAQKRLKSTQGCHLRLRAASEKQMCSIPGVVQVVQQDEGHVLRRAALRALGVGVRAVQAAVWPQQQRQHLETFNVTTVLKDEKLYVRSTSRNR